MPSRTGSPTDRWAEQIAALERTPGASHRTPITVDRIVEVALRLVETEGFDALTMRRVAVELHTGAASLYAHVRNKTELDDLLIGELCRRITLPDPEPARWQEQIVDVCTQLRDQYLRYPGISRAALAAAPRSLETVRINEGMLSILLAGGVAPQAAAWAIDAVYLYVSAYSLEASLRHRRDDEPGAHDDEALARLAMLPPDRFPNTVAHARELTSGTGHERFDFTLGLIVDGISSAPARDAATSPTPDRRRRSTP